MSSNTEPEPSRKKAAISTIIERRNTAASAGPAGQTDDNSDRSSVSTTRLASKSKDVLSRTGTILAKYAKFIGPGAMVSVAYIDPGNYATDVAAGATYRFKLLFIVLLSNIFAIYLQSLCIKLGSVTGMNLAQMIKAHTPKWLNFILYLFAEAAIVVTDIAEVIGTAIALNLLFKLPLVAGCAISIVDVLIILFFYRPTGTVRGLRAFELFVMALVFGVVICFCFQLSLIRNTTVGEVFRGYLPSSAIVQSQGLYQSCGILGATVMPHSLYLGSGMVQPRLLEFDKKHNPNFDRETTYSETVTKYRPSLKAIKSCMSYSIAELAISLFTFAIFVNSAILIIAGAALSDTPSAATADLFSIHTLLSQQLSNAAGVVFALALLLSGTSAGIVCTIAGQMVSEGQLSWSVSPWIRRLITRSISITPSIIIAGAVGAEGLSTALEASQVALSVILPFVSAPLIYFTCRAKYMGVTVDGDNGAGSGEEESRSTNMVQMRNNWMTTGFALVIWLIIVIMNVAALVLLGLGAGG
ncbi:hypothetical protein MBLNU457_6668t1 [Dothideomycetes sp. NU457]